MYKKDFPVFTTYPDLVYLDSASSAQKPQKVLDAMRAMIEGKYANIHRGAYDLSEYAEEIYEKSKEKVAKFIGASSRHEIVYTYNATYAFNLLSRSLVKSGILKKGDRVVLSLLEHHANIVPWQILADEYGIMIDWISVTEDGRIDYSDLEKKLPGAKILSITAASNVTGAITDFEKVQEVMDSLPLLGGVGGGTPPNLPYEGRNITKPLLIVDASQALPHFSLEVGKYGIDFAVATGHKVFSDTGIGILYGKKELLQKMDPALSGGGAINSVSRESYEPAGLPYRYEPGTPHILGAASLLAALEYIESIGGYEAMEEYEQRLVAYTLELIEKLPLGVHLIGPIGSHMRLGVFSFAFDHHHPRDVADTLADAQICVRAGHHCTEPLHTHLGLSATLRMSLGIYNTRENIESFINSINLLIDK